jgi:hypothetical protein
MNTGFRRRIMVFIVGAPFVSTQMFAVLEE